MVNQKISATIAKGKPGSVSRSNRAIYTLGSSVREKDQFVKLLEEFNIKVVADVRRFPKSRIDYFCKDKLSLFLRKNRIGYCYLGEKLGGFRENGYQEYTKTKDFLQGLEKLKEIAAKKRTAFMCAEKFPWRCHRRSIAQVLEKQGWRVIHIIDQGKTWETKTKEKSPAKKTKSLSLPI
jgi:uncharacterized protein (DUF488 family)